MTDFNNCEDIASSHRFQELCSDLNLDPATKNETVKEYYRIKDNYTLEVIPSLTIITVLLFRFKY